MADVDVLEQILSDLDTELRDRLKAAGLDVPHLLLAIAPDGAGVIRSNVGPKDLQTMAKDLDDIARQVDARSAPTSSRN